MPYWTGKFSSSAPVRSFPFNKYCTSAPCVLVSRTSAVLQPSSALKALLFDFTLPLSDANHMKITCPNVWSAARCNRRLITSTTTKPKMSVAHNNYKRGNGIVVNKRLSLWCDKFRRKLTLVICLHSESWSPFKKAIFQKMEIWTRKWDSLRVVSRHPLGM